MRSRERMPPAFRAVLRDRAREMRRHMTPAEVRLWSRLRGDRFMGLRFRRQHPCGPYLIDFFCHAARLAVELDGDSHADPEQAHHDMQRTRYVVDHGLKELRFTNHEVRENTDGVLAEIARHVGAAQVPLSPALSPEYRGEGARRCASAEVSGHPNAAGRAPPAVWRLPIGAGVVRQAVPALLCSRP